HVAHSSYLSSSQDSLRSLSDSESGLSETIKQFRFTLGQSERHIVVPFPHRIVYRCLPTMDCMQNGLHLRVLHRRVVDVEGDDKRYPHLAAQLGVRLVHGAGTR